MTKTTGSSGKALETKELWSFGPAKSVVSIIKTWRVPRSRRLVHSLLAQQNELLSPGGCLCLGLRSESWCSPTPTSHRKVDINKPSWAAPSPKEAIRPSDWCFHPSLGWRLLKGEPHKPSGFPLLAPFITTCFCPVDFPVAQCSARPIMPLVKEYSVPVWPATESGSFNLKAKCHVHWQYFNGPGLGRHPSDGLHLAVLFPASLVRFLGQSCHLPSSGHSWPWQTLDMLCASCRAAILLLKSTSRAIAAPELEASWYTRSINIEDPEWKGTPSPPRTQHEVCCPNTLAQICLP